jgi:amino acid adenylation domain-containing protein
VTPNRNEYSDLEVIGRLLANARSHPESSAVQDDGTRLSWRQLVAAAGSTAGSLAAAGVRPGDRVAIRLPNSVAFVTAALGCVWLGASFVPVSVEDPLERVDTIVATCRPSAMIELEPSLSRGVTRRLHPEELQSAGNDTVEPCRASRRDAYIIFTSGTTGQPKGVRISVESFAWAIATTAHRFGLTSATRSLSVSSFNFDGSYASLFTTLWAGGSVVIPPRNELLFGKRFFRSVLEEGATHTSFSPTYLRLLLKSPRMGDLAGSNLSTVALGGEELTVSDLRGLWDVMPDLRVFNIYGPTETTIQVTSFEVPKLCISSGEVPIGSPHEGVRFYVVGDDGAVNQDLGELHIGGRQLMSGYWGDDELTNRVLRHDVIPGEAVYKTGDLVKRDSEGWYYYRGRADDVVKRRGVRISLGEVGRALESIPEVEMAICLPIDEAGVLGIGAVIQSELDCPLPILRAARSQLPETMMPDKVQLLRTLPMNSSGKVDRAALSRLEW